MADAIPGGAAPATSFHRHDPDSQEDFKSLASEVMRHVFDIQ
jgi:hypothetical protein